MKAIDVLIIYEHIARELESAVLLEEKLIKAGYTVRLCQVGWNEGPAHLHYQPKIVVVPWCYDNREYDYFSKFVGSYEGNYLKILNIHCEQLSNANALALMIPSGKARDVYHLVWGKYFEDILKNKGVSPNLIYKTGSGRLDFFRKEYSGISKSRDFLANKYGLKSNKKWVLLIGNYNGGLLTNTGLDALEKKGYSNIQELAILTQKTYHTNNLWYEEACMDSEISDTVEFIYRPHPSEITTTEIKKIERDHNNFHIIQDYAIRDWIVNSDIAFSWNSTSAVEVASAGVPIFALRPFKIREDMQIPLLEYIEKVTTKEEFIERLKAKPDSSINKEFKEQISYYYSIDQEPAVDMICSIISKELNTKDNLIKGRGNVFFGLLKQINYWIKMFLYKTHMYPRFSQYAVLYENYASPDKVKEVREQIEGII